MTPMDVRVSRGFDRVARNPIRWALAAIGTGIVAGGLTFSLVEPQASMPDGMWWAFVSMTTVGYGDIAPHRTAERFIATGVIATGIAATAILTATLAGRIAERRLRGDHLTTPEIQDDLQAVIQRMAENINDLERLLPVVSDPRVVAALIRVHEERNDAQVHGRGARAAGS